MQNIDIRSSLKEATAALHDHVDRQFSLFDVRTQDGYSQILLAHHSAAIWYQPLFSEFVSAHVHVHAPDFLGMLSYDIAAAGLHPPEHSDQWRVSANPSPATMTGLCYAVSGSRLGTTALYHKWSQSMPRAHPIHSSHFFRDREGLQLWRDFLQWSATLDFSRQEVTEAISGAVATFELFSSAALRAEAIQLSAD